MQHEMNVRTITALWISLLVSLRQSLWRVAMALILAGGALLGVAPSAPAQAAGGLPSDILDPESVSWASLRNMTSAQFSADFQARKDDGYLVIDIDVEEIGGTQRVGAVWQKNIDNRGWALLRNMTSDEFSQKWTHYKDNNYRLIDQESYVLNDTRYYAGIWLENKENLAWASLRNLKDDEFSEKFQQYKDAGYIPVDVEGYPTGAGLRFAVIWVKNVENLEWREWRNLSSDEFSQKFQAYKDDFRMLDVESYRWNGNQYYAGIWVENKNNRKWAELRDMTSNTFGDKWQQYRDAGFRLTDFEVYPTANGWRYAGIWRQNTDDDGPLPAGPQNLVPPDQVDYDIYLPVIRN